MDAAAIQQDVAQYDQGSESVNTNIESNAGSMDSNAQVQSAETTDVDGATTGGANTGNADGTVQSADNGGDTTANAQPPALERDALMNELISKRRRNVQQDQQQTQQGEPSQPNDQGDTTGNTDVDGQSADAQHQAAQQSTQPDTTTQPEMVTLRVNGRDVQKTRAEVEAAGGVEALQKRLAGDYRLQEAAQRKAELERQSQLLAQRERELFEREQRMLAQTQQGPAQDGQQGQQDTSTDEELKQRAAKLAEAMILGDENELTETLTEVLSSTKQVQTPQAQVDPQQIAQVAAQQAAAEIERKTALEAAKAEFQKEFADVYNNPVMRMFANEQTKQIMAQNPNLSYREILQRAGQTTREMAGLSQQQQQATAQQTMQQRTQAKATQTAQRPQAAPMRQQGRKQEAKPKTRQQVFEEMMRARGQEP